MTVDKRVFTQACGLLPSFAANFDLHQNSRLVVRIKIGGYNQPAMVNVPYNLKFEKIEIFLKFKFAYVSNLLRRRQFNKRVLRTASICYRVLMQTLAYIKTCDSLLELKIFATFQREFLNVPYFSTTKKISIFELLKTPFCNEVKNGNI